MGKLIDGKAFANRLCETLAEEVASLKSEKQLTPCIAVVLVGEDPASATYVGAKVKRCEQLGIDSRSHHLDVTTSEEELLSLIDSLNNDPAVHGILVQLPVPKQINSEAVINAISPDKDVDGFHISNVGAMAVGQNNMVPCTPLGSMMLLEDELGDLSGLNAVVVGRSNIVGKPMATLLLQKSCTVTVAHSRTKDLPAVCRGADILVAAVGIPHFVKADWIKEGATVIDVGINRIQDPETGKNRLVGDVDFDAAKDVAGAITPVPGGVGPMTIACLMYNTVAAAKKLSGIA
ncbi:bifunctional methylenetetrahydrofolate dehydrogenase/methenyltetrahydrofolate cyclohydrolase FolD [Leucothrix arctica]|uniref:Bifunctional protein FolD n=1 Tax=Leucothrix arctica TaxID=1481894 RepID=A0A317CBF5_9GAMM|nr:bifunctional methylenetetrahydrofolate dehydrogenase/methenyltetrahydrofolate cyclohydrolase FolD [Leucothrix arctica]PWQ93690.1 bifunctional methylenetetrahydrofolate dehydrogenase/methenyltetrahydrofolate cyclohydrolase FolD [Leucothrix arctica]